LLDNKLSTLIPAPKAISKERRGRGKKEGEGRGRRREKEKGEEGRRREREGGGKYLKLGISLRQVRLLHNKTFHFNPRSQGHIEGEERRKKREEGRRREKREKEEGRRREKEEGEEGKRREKEEVPQTGNLPSSNKFAPR
jgi:hypothetical protein